MRIARPVPPTVEPMTLTSLSALGAAMRELDRARNVADVTMARNLRRSRALVRREPVR